MKRWRLYLERTKHGFTQEQIAHKLGLSKQGYNRIELGRRGASTEIWDALEDMFGVDQRVLRAVTEEKEEEEDHLWDYQAETWSFFSSPYDFAFVIHTSI